MSDDPALAPLLSLAFDRGPSSAANELIHATRQRVLDRLGMAVNYEVVLDGRGVGYLESVVAPRLSLYLKSKRMSATACGPVFVSLFSGDTLYFIAAADFFEFIRQRLGADAERFAQLTRGWAETGRAPAMLVAGPVRDEEI